MQTNWDTYLHHLIRQHDAEKTEDKLVVAVPHVDVWILTVIMLLRFLRHSSNATYTFVVSSSDAAILFTSPI